MEGQKKNQFSNIITTSNNTYFKYRGLVCPAILSDQPSFDVIFAVYLLSIRIGCSVISCRRYVGYAEQSDLRSHGINHRGSADEPATKFRGPELFSSSSQVYLRSVDKRPQGSNRYGYVMALEAKRARSARTNGDTHNKLTERSKVFVCLFVLFSWLFYFFFCFFGWLKCRKGGRKLCVFGTK